MYTRQLGPDVRVLCDLGDTRFIYELRDDLPRLLPRGRGQGTADGSRTRTTGTAQELKDNCCVFASAVINHRLARFDELAIVPFTVTAL